MHVGYLIPEFPGQTHVWMWREILPLRRWAVALRIFSTRRPPERDRARHGFAASAEAETTYLWPISPWRALRAAAWASLTQGTGLARAIALAWRLPVNGRFRRLRLLLLVVPACELARECGRSGVTHLHSHGCAKSAILCMMVKRIAGIPFSMTLNANIEWWGGAMAEKFRDAEFTIAITQWLLDQMRRDFPGLGPRQTLLGRIGVDTSLWSPGARAPESGEAVRLITVARLHRTKGHDVLLDALAALQGTGRKLSLRIVGDGPQRVPLEDQVRRLGLAGCVTLLGSLGQEEIIDEMRRSDVFVLPSRFEPLGVAYMEAMSMEVATIGTRTGGVSEIIDDGVDGLLVEPENVAALAEAIERLAADAGLRGELGRAGRRKIVTQFDSAIGAATLYERLTGSRPPAATSRLDEAPVGA